MQAIDLINKAAETLHDTSFVRWTKAMYYKYITDAQRAIVSVRPDANPVIAIVNLTTNTTVQSIPATGYQLLDVIRNTNAGGTSFGEVVTLTTKEALDSANRDWHSETGSDTIYNFAYDERIPQHYFVSPPPASGVYVEIRYSKVPNVITTDADVLEVNDSFSDALFSYVMSRALSVNIDSTQDKISAKGWLANFYLLTGQTAQAVALLSPNNTNVNATINVPGQG